MAKTLSPWFWLLFPGFLSASREGLSHAEIEDLLSIDDESLQDTYLYHLPPDPDNIRIPSSVLSLLVKDIKDYMVMQKSGSKKVVKWYHRQFTEVSIYNFLPLFIILFFCLVNFPSCENLPGIIVKLHIMI